MKLQVVEQQVVDESKGNDIFFFTNNHLCQTLELTTYNTLLYPFYTFIYLLPTSLLRVEGGRGKGFEKESKTLLYTY